METYALIQNALVVNTVLASSSDPQDPNFVWVDITNLSPQPGIGWSYSSGSFIAPTPPAPPTLTADEINQMNMSFGADLLNQFAVLNTTRGLTPQQKYQLAINLGPIATMLLSGDLASVLALLPGIPVDGVLITQDIINSFVASITAFLGTE